MKTLFSQEEFNMAKSRDKLPLECYECHKKFYISKNIIQQQIKSGKKFGKAGKYCSKKCSHQANNLQIIVKCKQCGCKFKKERKRVEKSNNHFCSKSCAATYNNTHKTIGTRRSKLEIWLEDQLTLLYPDLEIHFNRKDAINSELDIYIPSLKLAFELNGIFHYEPIYGQKKLASIQNNDERKFQACLEQGIELCIIDVSSMNYFKEKRAQKFLSIIKDKTNFKLS